MAVDVAALKSALVTELAPEFPWASPEQLDKVAQATAAGFADATVVTFLPILARRAARTAMRTPPPASGEAAVRHPRGAATLTSRR